jgi:hypothetical protein
LLPPPLRLGILIETISNHTKEYYSRDSDVPRIFNSEKNQGNYRIH